VPALRQCGSCSAGQPPPRSFFCSCTMASGSVPTYPKEAHRPRVPLHALPRPLHNLFAASLRRRQPLPLLRGRTLPAAPDARSHPADVPLGDGRPRRRTHRRTRGCARGPHGKCHGTTAAKPPPAPQRSASATGRTARRHCAYGRQRPTRRDSASLTPTLPSRPNHPSLRSPTPPAPMSTSSALPSRALLRAPRRRSQPGPRRPHAAQTPQRAQHRHS
jgi:hypothetical protein